MIYAKLADLKLYQNIPHLEDILKFINNDDLLKLLDGDFDILGKDLYLRVMHYNTEPIEKRKFEAHRYYADLQIILSGAEKIQITASDHFDYISDYNTENDVQFFSTLPQYVSDINIEKNQFIFLSAGELHKPMCYHQSASQPVFKIVFKIKQ
ncbi:MAG: YhcH/YjgK/YiaL family protein [bacterium]|nr:YhcH/YjgK/YiaL family protein [bacterium]